MPGVATEAYSAAEALGICRELCRIAGSRHVPEDGPEMALWHGVTDRAEAAIARRDLPELRRVLADFEAWEAKAAGRQPKAKKSNAVTANADNPAPARGESAGAGLFSPEVRV